MPIQIKDLNNKIKLEKLNDLLNNNNLVYIKKNTKIYGLIKIFKNKSDFYILMFTEKELKNSREYQPQSEFKHNTLYTLESINLDLFIFRNEDYVYGITKKLFERSFNRANIFLLDPVKFTIQKNIS